MMKLFSETYRKIKISELTWSLSELEDNRPRLRGTGYTGYKWEGADSEDTTERSRQSCKGRGERRRGGEQGGARKVERVREEIRSGQGRQGGAGAKEQEGPRSLPAPGIGGEAPGGKRKGRRRRSGRRTEQEDDERDRSETRERAPFLEQRDGCKEPGAGRGAGPREQRARRGRPAPAPSTHLQSPPRRSPRAPRRSRAPAGC